MNNPVAISAYEARQMRLAQAWRMVTGNQVLVKAIDKRKKHASFKVPFVFDSPEPLVEELVQDLVDFSKQLGYKVRITNNKHSKRLTLRWT